MKHTLLVILILVLFCGHDSNAQKVNDLNIEVPEGPTPWTGLDFNRADDKFQFVIVTDRTGGHRAGVFPEALRKVNLLQPEFVMSVGDLIEGYTEDTLELNRQWEEFDGFIDQLQMPFFYVPGNHDITNELMQELWKQRFGPTYYHFTYKDVLFLCLDSEDQYRGAGRGSISDQQFEYIKTTLQENDDVRWTLVFMHQPLWLQDDPVRWPEVEMLLSQREHTVFTGHVHHYVRWERNNGRYYTLATTGGGSRLRGPKVGEFDQVVWVTMTSEGPIMANLQLSGIWSEDVVTGDDYDFISSLQKSEPIRISPIYKSTTDLRSEVTVQIHNPVDNPVEVTVTDRFSFDYTSSLDKDMMTIGPNGVGEFVLDLRPRKENTSSKAVVPLEVNLRYAMDNDAKVDIPFTYNVGLEEKYPIKPGTAPEIDGELEEWGELEYRWHATDTSDLNAAFSVKMDEDFLYLAAKVHDDMILRDTQVAVWQQDYLGVVINGDPLARSVMNTGRAWYNESFAIALNPAVPNLEPQSLYEDRYPEELDYKWATKTSGGTYTFELALPLGYIEERQGEDWRSARINLWVLDMDEDEEEEFQYWQPSWREDGHRVGSGMFFRVDK